MLQLSGTFFKGTHEELIGTEILFTDGRGVHSVYASHTHTLKPPR